MVGCGERELRLPLRRVGSSAVLLGDFFFSADGLEDTQ